MIIKNFKMVTGDKKVYKVTYAEYSNSTIKVLKITCPNGTRYRAKWINGELDSITKNSNRSFYSYFVEENNIAELKRFPMWIIEKFDIFYNVAVI